MPFYEPNKALLVQFYYSALIKKHYFNEIENFCFTATNSIFAIKFEMPKQKFKTHFQDIWLENPSFKRWVLKHPTGNYMARCKVCSKDISITTNVIKAIVKHSKGSKH